MSSYLKKTVTIKPPVFCPKQLNSIKNYYLVVGNNTFNQYTFLLYERSVLESPIHFTTQWRQIMPIAGGRKEYYDIRQGGLQLLETREKQMQRQFCDICKGVTFTYFFLKGVVTKNCDSIELLTTIMLLTADGEFGKHADKDRNISQKCLNF